MSPKSTLHLCNAHGQLLFALCDIALHNAPTTLVYLHDEVGLSQRMLQRLRETFPNLDVLVMRDAEAISEFQNLPNWLPDIVRRNLRVDQSTGLSGPQRWCPVALAGKRFDQAYIYHSGFFMAKVVSGMADRVVLREAGLHNYETYPVGAFKGLLRLAKGLPPGQQIIGEEGWIDALEVARPEHLPAKLRGKAQWRNLNDFKSQLTPARTRDIINVFAPVLPKPNGSTPSALLLTQPLDKINICTIPNKIKLYQRLAYALRRKGYAVFVKNHPRENAFALADTEIINRHVPIEVWSMAQREPFGCAVALCSAALSGGQADFCDRAIQLVPPDQFNRFGFDHWSTRVEDDLLAALTP